MRFANLHTSRVAGKIYRELIYLIGNGLTKRRALWAGKVVLSRVHDLPLQNMVAKAFILFYLEIGYLYD